MSDNTKGTTMSEKNSKYARKEAKVLEFEQNKENLQAQVDDLHTQINAATKNREDKLELDMEFLLSNLAVVSEKYKTVEGYMDARQTFESLIFGTRCEEHDNIAQEICTTIARTVSDTAAQLVSDIEAAGIDGIELSILHGIVKKDFLGSEFSNADVCRELLLSNLMGNVEPLIEKMVDFRDQSAKAITEFDVSIAEAEAELAAALKAE